MVNGSSEEHLHYIAQHFEFQVDIQVIVSLLQTVVGIFTNFFKFPVFLLDLNYFILK